MFILRFTPGCYEHCFNQKYYFQSLYNGVPHRFTPEIFILRFTPVCNENSFTEEIFTPRFSQVYP